MPDFDVDDIYGGSGPPPEKVRVRLFVRRDKESNDYVIEEGDLTPYKNLIPDKARENFWYALYEIGLDVEVELKTGYAEIVGVEGHPLAVPVKA